VAAGLPFQHRLEREIRIVEGQIRLDQIHREPLADALRRGLLACVGDRVVMGVESLEEHLRIDADDQPAGEVRVIREVLRERER